MHLDGAERIFADLVLANVAAFIGGAALAVGAYGVLSVATLATTMLVWFALMDLDELRLRANEADLSRYIDGRLEFNATVLEDAEGNRWMQLDDTDTKRRIPLRAKED